MRALTAQDVGLSIRRKTSIFLFNEGHMPVKACGRFAELRIAVQSRVAADLSPKFPQGFPRLWVFRQWTRRSGPLAGPSYLEARRPSEGLADRNASSRVSSAVRGLSPLCDDGRSAPPWRLLDTRVTSVDSADGWSVGLHRGQPRLSFVQRSAKKRHRDANQGAFHRGDCELSSSPEPAILSRSPAEHL